MSQSLRYVSVVDALVDALRDAIINGEYPSGQRISEIELVRRFDVARPTVRSALQVLVQEGTLRREPNRSVYVPRLSAEDVNDLFRVRALVELAAVRAVIESHADLSTVERAVATMEALGSADRWHDTVLADLAFHHAIVTAAGSPRLTRIYGSILHEVRLSIALLRPAYSTSVELASEHRLLLESVRTGSVDAAQKAMSDHLESAVNVLLSGAGVPHGR